MVGGVLIVRVFVVVGGLVAVGGSLAVVVVARSLVVPRRRRSRSASAVNGVVTGWGRSRSNCLVLDNLAFGCRTVGHAGSLGAMRDGSIRKQAGAEEGERRRRREQAGAVQAGYAAGRCNHGSSNLGTSLASEARAFLIAMMMGTGQHFISNSHLRLRPARASLLWSGRRLLPAASWPTSQTYRPPHRPLRPHLPKLPLLLPLLLLPPPLNLDPLLRHKSFPIPSSELHQRCKMATVAPFICLCWPAWSSLLPSSLTFTGNIARLT